MKSLTLILAVVSLLISLVTMPAEAGVEVLNPYTGVTWTAGNTETVKWKENGNSPSLSTLKSMTIYLMAGTQENQFTVATIASNVDGSTLTCPYTVPKDVGPEGNFYFIKFTQGTYNAYSGYFTIKGVSGTIPNFNPSNPGVPLSTTTGSASSSPSSTDTDTDATTTTSSNSTTTTKSSKISKSLSDDDIPTSTAAATTGTAAAKTNGNNGPTTSPTSKSSSGNKLTTSFSILSLALFVAAALYSS